MAAAVVQRDHRMQKSLHQGGLRGLYLEDAKLQKRPTLYSAKEDVMSLATVISNSESPDIGWNPSYQTYMDRNRRMEVRSKDRVKVLPPDFPACIDKPWVWSGSDISEEDYVVKLNLDDILEIQEALRFFHDFEGYVELDDVTPVTFPLPNLGPRLRAIANTIHLGIGFSVIRGLDPRKYSALDNLILYLGITSYIAKSRGCQDSSGNMLIHVKDLGQHIPDSDLRQSPYACNAQPFHNDVCDVLAMYVREQALEGGESHLASCAKVYNEIASTRPDVIHTLAEPSWAFDKHQTPAHWNTRALLFNFGDKGPGFCFSRRPITGSPTSPRSPGVPRVTETQAEALDMVHFTALKHKVTMRLQRGDIQLVNNLAIQHARNAFKDSHFHKRHIMRLWLRNEDLAWETPNGLQKTWIEKYGDSDRRKIARWNIFPGASRARVLFRSDSCS